MEKLKQKYKRFRTNKKMLLQKISELEALCARNKQDAIDNANLATYLWRQNCSLRAKLKLDFAQGKISELDLVPCIVEREVKSK